MIFILDTNALWKTQRIGRLSRASRARGHRLQVPALVHAERVAQLRRRQGSAFDMAIVQAFIDTHLIEVAPFDRVAAEAYAAQIATRYPREVDWHAAKRARCATRFQVAADAGAACPATVDWFIARSHRPSDDGTRVIVVTDDAGLEYDGVDVLSLDRAIELAESRPTAAGDVADESI